MPELPEVEIVRGAMEALLLGRTVTRVQASRMPLRAPQPVAGLQALRGQGFVSARRRAKYLLLEMSDGQQILVHLGMSGNLLFRPGGQRHDHIVFVLDYAPPLVFNDPRRFGMVLLLRADEVRKCPYLCHLGVEPLSRDFDGRYLREQCRGRARPIKNLLMDSRIVAGIGNIYASEAPTRARVTSPSPSGVGADVQLEGSVVVMTSSISP